MHNFNNIKSRIEIYAKERLEYIGYWKEFMARAFELQKEAALESGIWSLTKDFYKIKSLSELDSVVLIFDNKYHISFIPYEKRSLILHRKISKDIITGKTDAEKAGEIWIDMSGNLYSDHYKNDSYRQTVYDVADEDTGFKGMPYIILLHLNILMGDLTKKYEKS